MQSRRVHTVSGVMDDRQVPYCRDSPFVQDPKRQGEGFGLPALPGSHATGSLCLLGRPVRMAALKV